MTPFLQLVANDLRHKYGTDLSHLVVVFPNKRAGLFLNDYLVPPDSSGAEGIVWAPQYRTISELFRSLSSLVIADPIACICRLYHIYSSLVDSPESLDYFYGWGERIMADFDDVDKHRVDAHRLFRNLADIKKLETFDYIDDERERALHDFFSDFSLQKNTRLRQRFLELWEKLYLIYERLNSELSAEGLAYEGALYRRVIDDLETGRVVMPNDNSRYVFVGFNVLDDVEHALFRYLQEHGRASFYWDYDVTYASATADAEAGTFLRRNLRDFPNALTDETCFVNLLRGKDIEFVSAPTENAQARAVAPWLREHLTTDEKRTAVVLCNETLLQPVLHSLPESVREVNVTKGYPLYHTPAYRLMETLMARHTPDIDNVVWLTEVIARIKERAAIVPLDDDISLDQTLSREAYFQTYLIVNRFYRLVTDMGLDVEVTTLHKLIRQVMRQESVPFHGEPAAGLQVMGILETRCLDFENLLMLSVNEGNLPRRITDNSFIPNILRRSFGLTTEQHRLSVYAYYFYRLIQRASHIRMIYNNATQGSQTGEMSRFMTQLLIETKLPIRCSALTASIEAKNARRSIIRKPDNLVERLRRISPSAINTYLRCQILFFYQYVARLNAPQPSTGFIDPNIFGNVFHKTAELFYNHMTVKADGCIQSDLLRPFIDGERDEQLQDLILRAMKEENVPEDRVLTAILMMYMKNLIKYDCSFGQFRVMETERRHSITLAVSSGERLTDIGVMGNIDRVDLLHEGQDDECLRIVDYKTGGRPEVAKDLEQLFTPSPNRPHYILQTFIYALFMFEQTVRPLRPELFFVHKAATDDYTSRYKFAGHMLDDFRPLARDFRKRLVKLLSEIIDTSRPFVPTDDICICQNCLFSPLCRH